MKLVENYGQEASGEVLFRFRVISLVEGFLFQGFNYHGAVHRAADMPHFTITGEMRRVSIRTVYRWMAAYRSGGVSGLEPNRKQSGIISCVYTNEFLSFLKMEKELDQEASVPELIKRARESGIVSFDARIDRTTVYRTLLRMGYSMKRRKKQRGRDSRRFAYPHHMQMVLCDGKHFRAGITSKKRVALFFLDDCSRFGLHVVVGTSENSHLFLRGLYEAIKKYGFMGILYIDRGPGFKNENVLQVAQRMDIKVIYGEKAYPEAHGKVERFNQTAKQAVLRHYDGRADIDPDCCSLELRLQHYLREIYNHTHHEGLKA